MIKTNSKISSVNELKFGENLAALAPPAFSHLWRPQKSDVSEASHVGDSYQLD